MENAFTRIENAWVITVKDGVYNKGYLYEYKGYIHIKTRAGYSRLIRGFMNKVEAHCNKKTYIVDNIVFPDTLYTDQIGRLCTEECKGKYAEFQF